MTKIIVLLTFILNSFFYQKGDFEQSAFLDRPTPSKKLFIEFESRINHHLIKDSTNISSDDLKSSLFNHNYFFARTADFKFNTHTSFTKKIALHKLHCIWII